MATLSELIENQLVLRWQVDLPSRQQSLRMLLLLPELKARLDATLAVGSSWNLEETPEQQLDALTSSFVAGEPLAFGWQFKYLAHYGPTPEGIWYLKTADIRLFGWFHLRDCFIAGSAGIAGAAKRYHLYRGFGDEVMRFRDRLPLDEPKFVGGDDPHAVVSNFTHPA
jgi:hypothetical protein